MGKETFADQLSRVRAMTNDKGDTWDLSDNDQAALAAVLERMLMGRRSVQNEVFAALFIREDGDIRCAVCKARGTVPPDAVHGAFSVVHDNGCPLARMARRWLAEPKPEGATTEVEAATFSFSSDLTGNHFTLEDESGEPLCVIPSALFEKMVAFGIERRLGKRAETVADHRISRGIETKP